MLTETTRQIDVRETLPADGWKAQRFLEYLGDKGLTGVPKNPLEIRDYPEWLRQRGYKPNSVIAALVPVRDLYRTFGIDTRKIIKAPRVNLNYLRDPLPEEDVSALLRYIDNHESLRNRALVRLMLYLALRDIEIHRMDVEDFYRHGQTWCVRVWGKARDNKEDVMHVTGGLLPVFLEYHRSRLESGAGPSDPMFPNKFGTRLRPDGISRLVTTIMERAGVKGYLISAHSCRHAAVTKHAKESGYNLLTTQQFARHKNPRTTNIYIRMGQRTEHLVNWEGA